VPLLWLRVPAVFFHFLKDFKNYCASCWSLFVVVIADARNHEPEKSKKNIVVFLFLEQTI
jgi:hypothetical protein